jgi:hypothetical protein
MSVGCCLQAMYSDERWEGLRSQFKDTFFSVYGITSLPLLSLAVSAGLSTLKLSACLPNAPHATPSQPSEIPPQDPNTAVVLSIPSLAAAPPVHVMDSTTIDPALPMMTDPTPLHDHPEHPQRNIDCPTCAKDLSILAREVPFSHHVNSTLVCRISGEVMDDTNYPMAFPNGYVYSYNVSRTFPAFYRTSLIADALAAGLTSHGQRAQRSVCDLSTNGRTVLLQPIAKSVHYIASIMLFSERYKV